MVAQVEQFGRGRVVRGTQGVDAHRLQHFELTLDGARVHRRAETAKVVVVADAPDLQRLAVEDETALAVEDEVADAEGRLVTVCDPAVAHDLRDGLVQIRTLGRPKGGPAQRQLLTDFRGRALRRLRFRFRPRDRLARRVIDNRPQHDPLSVRRIVPDLRPDLDGRRVVAHPRRRDVCAPVLDVNFVNGRQPDVAVDA